MGYNVDSTTALGTEHKQISSETKECLKPVLIEDIRGPFDQGTSSSEYIFGENLAENMREAKENYELSSAIIITTSGFGKSY